MEERRDVIIIQAGDDELFHPAFEGSVTYDPTYEGVASYRWRENDILFGKKAPLEKEEALRGIARHEKSHAIFLTMPQAGQNRIFNALLGDLDNPSLALLLAEHYRLGYNPDYFVPPSRQTLQEMILLHRGFQADIRRDLFGREIFMPALMTEFLAELVEHNSFATFSPQMAEMRKGTTQLVAMLYDHLQPTTVDLLNKSGLLRFDAFDIMEKLRQDDAFINASIRIGPTEDV